MCFVFYENPRTNLNYFLSFFPFFKPDTSVSFIEHCDFEDKDICEMRVCSKISAAWERKNQADGGPNSDHTYLGSASQGRKIFVEKEKKRKGKSNSDMRLMVYIHVCFFFN